MPLHGAVIDGDGDVSAYDSGDLWPNKSADRTELKGILSVEGGRDWCGHGILNVSDWL
jgi:hypothetical protein